MHNSNRFNNTINISEVVLPSEISLQVEHWIDRQRVQQMLPTPALSYELLIVPFMRHIYSASIGQFIIMFLLKYMARVHITHFTYKQHSLSNNFQFHLYTLSLRQFFMWQMSTSHEQWHCTTWLLQHMQILTIPFLQRFDCPFVDSSM